MENCCKEIITSYNLGWPRSRQCSRKAKEDGYCKQHHPDSVMARQEASEKRHQENMEWSVRERLKRTKDEIAALVNDRDQWQQIAEKAILERNDLRRELDELEALLQEQD